MRTYTRLVPLLLLAMMLLVSCKQHEQQQALTFLHTSGYDFVNEKGQKVFLKGVGLGNWMLPEGYMWKFGEGGDRPRKIEKVVADLIGEDKAAAFWKEFRQNYITEADIEMISRLGFNSVRPALNARLFLTEGENPVFIDEGFQLLDSLVSWCKKHRLYVIIDMHGAPGGQTGANIDDSPNDIPELFIHQKHQDQLVALWVKIATRYKNEPVVAAYDLLNEPLPINTGSADTYKHLLVPLYKRITSAIRSVDQRHMITLEGFNWSNDWSLFDTPFDDNVFYQFHYYCWNKPDNLNNIDYYIRKREELNTPVWVGETGEKGNAIYWATAQYFEANNIGFSFWPWKKMDTQNTPYSIKKPVNWDLISEYTKGGAKPDSLLAEKAFQELLENCKLANCEYFADVVNSILCRVPGKIEAENYGHLGFHQSYFVADTTQRAETYRVNEPVSIKVLRNSQEQRTSEQYVELKEKEWVVYYFDNHELKNAGIAIQASAATAARVSVQVNDELKEVQINNTDWMVLSAGEVELKPGRNEVKVIVTSGVVKIDWLTVQ